MHGLFLGTVLVGVSGAFAWATFTSAPLLDVDEDRYGQANGVALTVRQMGAALGVAMVISLVGDHIRLSMGVWRIDDGLPYLFDGLDAVVPSER
ncbi:MAG: hypothetical protein ACI9TF_000138 [Paracrocinitomix sp.]